jgi:hypothetical protein
MEEKKICEFFLEGKCQKGDNCRRSHDVGKRQIKPK